VKYIEATGVCGYCVTYDTTPDRRFKKLYEAKAETNREKTNGQKRTH